MFLLQSRLRAAGIHLCINLVVAGVAALLVFWVWYPWPYRDVSGGSELFVLVVTVDVVLGPLLTFAVFDMRKGIAKMRFDLAVIAALQLAGLSYGLWTVFEARPVHLVFEYSMFRVVHANEVAAAQLPQAQPGLRRLPLTGPTLLSLRPFANPSEQFNSTMAALQGASLSGQPALWQPYGDAKFALLTKARPLAALYARFPAKKALIDAAVQATGRAPGGLVWLPLAGRKTFWTVLVAQDTALPVGYLPLDSF